MSMVESVSAEDLAEAVRASRSWRGVLRALCLPESSSRLGRLVRARCDELCVDYSHFDRHRSWTDADLSRLVPEATSWAELMTSLRCSTDSRSGRITVRNHCARLGLDLAHLPDAAEAVGTEDRRGIGQIRPENLRRAGAMLVSAVLTMQGYQVSWPLEPALYDLVVDAGDRGHLRVQVKTTTRWRSGTWLCEMGRHTYCAGASGKRRERYDVREIDYFAVVDGNMSVYLIPSAVVGGRLGISLRRYRRFLVAAGPLGQWSTDVGLTGFEPATP